MVARAPAQIGSIADGNASFDLYSVPGSASADAPRIRFAADPTLAPSAFSFWWYYRIEGDTRESALNASNGQLVDMDFRGKIASMRWDDVDGRGIRAMYFIHVHATGPGTAQLVHSLTFENHTASPITLHAFAYADIDNCGSFGRDTAVGSIDRHVVSDAACPGADIEFFGVGASHYSVANWPFVLNSLIDTTPTNLPDSGLPFATPADYTGAMQWTAHNLAPGEQMTVVATISHADSFVPCSTTASSMSFGVPVGGVLGAPRMTSVAPPVVGSCGQLLIENGPPGASGVLLFGHTLTNGMLGLPVPTTSLTLYMQAISSTSITLDNQGSFRFSRIPLPLAASILCGGRTPHFHAWIADPSVPGGFSQTEVVAWTVGH